VLCLLLAKLDIAAQRGVEAAFCIGTSDFFGNGNLLPIIGEDGSSSILSATIHTRPYPHRLAPG
jgi:hypothetical protein